MDNQRAIALLIAVAAALLVVLAGRSCMKNIEEQNKEAEKNKPAVYSSPIITETTTAEIIVPSAAETTEPYSGETTAVTTTKSMLDEFWDSEQPNYLDPYGYYGGMKLK